MAAKILIIDDQPQGLQAVLEWLRQQEHDLTLLSKGDEALKTIRQIVPDLILVSASLSGMDGIELCRRLRRDSSAARIPIIVLLPENAGALHTQGVLAGANDFIVKPVAPTHLREVQRRLSAILDAPDLSRINTRRLLEETCQSALTILPCDVAWLLIAEGMALHSRAIVTAQGPNAAEAFLRLITEGSADHPSFPLVSGNNPISDAALGLVPALNVPTQQLRDRPNGVTVYRALTQLHLTHVHLLPLALDGQVAGMLILGCDGELDTSTSRGQQVFKTLLNQAMTVVENARLLNYLNVHEEHLKSEQAFRRMVLDTMGDGLLVIDDDAIIRYTNNRLLSMSGYTRQELYGHSVGIIFHPSGREALLESLGRQGRTTVSFAQQLVTRTGQVVPVLMSRATAPETKPTEQQTVVLVLSDLTEQKKREQDLERQSERLRALNQAVQTITSALSLEDVIEGVLEATLQIVQCLNVCIFIQSEAQPEILNVIAARGPQAESLRSASIQVGQGIAGQVVQNRAAQFVPYLSEGLETSLEREGDSVIAVPLIVVDQVIGVLEAVNGEGKARFTQDDAELLENLAAAASAAIENARLYGQAQRQVNELSMMLDASAAVSSTLDIGSVLELIARRLTEAMSVARCAIASWDRVSHQLVTLAEACNAFWLPGQGPARPLGGTPFVMALQREQPSIVKVTDPGLDPAMRDYFMRTGMRQAMLIPLAVGPNVAGLIEVYSAHDERALTGQHVQLVRDAAINWRNKLSRSREWFDFDNLTDLCHAVERISRSTWCIISYWDRREKSLRALREIGFAVWEESEGASYRLDKFPTMSTSLQQGMPMTLLPALLVNDAEERGLMAQTGAHTGLIIPLLVRGEASGLVKLLDVTPDRSFDIAEISLCQGIANVVGNALENARLYQSLAKRANALQAAYDELRDSDKLKDSLIQNLSHELKTPLMQMIFELTLLSEGDFGALNADQKNNVDSVMKRLAQLGGRVNNMVSLNDSQALSFEPVRLDEVVGRAIEMARPKVQRTGLRILPYLQPDLPRVRADKDRLLEVFDQLLDNAIKFSPAADRVEMRINVVSGVMVQISIRDYGIGIEKSEFEKIFQRGYQVDAGLTRRFGGAGMGLAIVRQIIEAHGGKIWVESTPSAGSQFTFSIPRWS